MPILNFVCLGFILCYLVSLIAGHKRIMAEGIMVVQVAFVGIANLSKLNPL